MTLKLFPILLTCALSTDHFTWMHFKFNMLKANSFFPPITATQCIPPLPEMPLGLSPLLHITVMCGHRPLATRTGASTEASCIVFSLSYTGFSQNCLKAHLLKIKSSLKNPLSAQPH